MIGSDRLNGFEVWVVGKQTYVAELNAAIQFLIVNVPEEENA